MKNKKILIMTIMSIFLLVSLTAISVTGMKAEVKKDVKENEVLEAKYEYSFASIDGEVFQSFGMGAVKVAGLNNFLIAKDITVQGTVPFSLTENYKFIINPLFGPRIVYESGDGVNIHIKTMLLPSIGTQCTPPYISSISGPAFGVTIYEYS